MMIEQVLSYTLMGVFTQLTLHTIVSWVQPLVVFPLPALAVEILLGYRFIRQQPGHLSP